MEAQVADAKSATPDVWYRRLAGCHLFSSDAVFPVPTTSVCSGGSPPRIGAPDDAQVFVYFVFSLDV
jgi:hypothetical protein